MPSVLRTTWFRLTMPVVGLAPTMCSHAAKSIPFWNVWLTLASMGESGSKYLVSPVQLAV